MELTTIHYGNDPDCSDCQGDLRRYCEACNPVTEEELKRFRIFMRIGIAGIIIPSLLIILNVLNLLPQSWQ